jgi:hypothetical protein
MVKFYSSLNQDHIDFITSQSDFYVASAPWAGDHIDVSPKSDPSRTLAVLGPNTVAYLDAGSGCETVSHIYENGRLTLMFASSGPSPQILRLFGKARVVEKWGPHFQQLLAKMATESGDELDITGARVVIVLKVQKVQISSGSSVTSGEDRVAEGTEGAIADAKHESETEEAGSKDDEIVEDNLRSLDGLPGMSDARRARDENMAVEDTKAWFRKVSRQQDAVALGVGLGILFIIFLSLAGVLKIRVVFIEHILNYQRRQMGIPEDHSWKSEL